MAVPIVVGIVPLATIAKVVVQQLRVMRVLSMLILAQLVMPRVSLVPLVHLLLQQEGVHAKTVLQVHLRIAQAH